ncbi:hypothetical protein CGRA01v4_11359 [Colletotrichum graminicola]|nr:hypothetical protein CGRA01v4_11359 [Colletotrichum graminicola]
MTRIVRRSWRSGGRRRYLSSPNYLRDDLGAPILVHGNSVEMTSFQGLLFAPNKTKGALLDLPFRHSYCRHPHRFGLSVVRTCLDNACMQGQTLHMSVCCVGSHEGGNPSSGFAYACVRECAFHLSRWGGEPAGDRQSEADGGNPMTVRLTRSQ